jgi:hypothetical protein
MSAHKDLQLPATYPIDQVKTPVMEPDMAIVEERQLESERYEEVAKVHNSTTFDFNEKEEKAPEKQHQMNKKRVTVKSKDCGMDRVISTDGHTFRVMYDADIECLNIMFDRDEPISCETTKAMEEMSQVLVEEKRLDRFLMGENMMTSTPKTTNVESLQVEGKQIKKTAKKARQKATKDGTEATRPGTWQLECTNVECTAGVGRAPFKTPALMPAEALAYLGLHRESAHGHYVNDAEQSAMRITCPIHPNPRLEHIP